jgi:hypothetical protein
MKYMLLMQANRAGWQSFGSMPPEDIRAHVGFMIKLNEQLAAAGELVDAQGLAPPEQARTVQARPGGTPAITDGPFSEAKEFLAGYWLIECPGIERATEIAAYISTAPGRGGAPMNFPVEVRPLGVKPNP